MRLTSDISLNGNTWKVQIGPSTNEPFSQTETDALQSIGYPAVDCGGTFTGTVSGHSLSFTLPSNQLLFPSQFPLVQLFDNTDPLAVYNVQLYRTSIETVIQTAVTAVVAAFAAVNAQGHWETTLATS